MERREFGLFVSGIGFLVVGTAYLVVGQLSAQIGVLYLLLGAVATVVIGYEQLTDRTVPYSEHL